MKYWERWVGDWKKKTLSLSAEQKGIYAELLDYCYVEECDLPLEHEAVYRVCSAITPSERKSCDLILSKFFTKNDRGWANARVVEEIEKRYRFIQKQSDRAKLRWSKPDADGVVKPAAYKGNGAWWKSREGREEMATKMGVKTRIGEETPEYVSRIFEAINAAKAQAAAQAPSKFSE